RLSNPIARRPGDLPQPCAAVRAPTAGAVALARLPGERLMLIVGRWDSDVLDFYLSSGDRLEEARFQRVDSWCTAEARDAEGRTARFGRYQALILLPACGGDWFLIGFETSDGRDLAALFRLELRLDATDLG